MKIKKIQIKNYKNLDADLVHNSDMIAFIGNNGSGKSNLLEAISHIFRSLYMPKYKVNFDYTIEYVTSKNNTVQIEKIEKEFRYFLDGNDKSAAEISNYLPQKVIGIYSGEETRLFDDCFGPFYLEFITNINRAQTQGTVYSELPRMLFLNSFYWNISLLCLLISDSDDNKRFVEQVLRIQNVDKIKIKIDFIKRNYANYNDNQALRLVRDIDSKSEYTLAELTELLNEKFYTPFNVFKYLYLAYTPKDAKIIDGIIIEFSNGLTVSDLSEGEKKLLLIKGALEFAGQEDSIFILDEPDSHIHINNKEQITNSFIDYLHNRQIILTTHSPTLTQCINDENVYMLNSGKIIDKNKQEIIEEVTGEFWNKHQQNSFIASKKPIVLLVEGKHDKEHILNAYEKLKDEYPELSFDIFYMNSACNIPPMLMGLRTSEIEYKKLFIGIFDDDQTGNVELSNTTCKFPSDQNAKRHKEGYFAFTYPKHEHYKSTVFTVENFFDPSHLEAAYNSALIEFTGKFKGKSLQTISDDVKDKAKSKLFENSKTFTDKEDFKHFRKLFDKIKEIKKYHDQKKASLPAPVIVPVRKEEKISPSAGDQANNLIKIRTNRRETVVNAEYYNDQKVILKVGSKLSKSVVESYNAVGRDKDLNDIAENKDDHWLLKTDKQLNSVSGAINYATGGNMNGWDDWIIVDTGLPLSTVRDSHNGIKIKFQEDVYNELLKQLSEGWIVEIGVKADLANAQIWIKPSESNKLWFGIETFSGKGNFANSLITGVFSPQGVVKRKTLAGAVYDELSNQKGFWLEYTVIKDVDINLDFNSISLLDKIEGNGEYRAYVLNLIVTHFMEYFNKRTDAVRKIIE